MPQNPDRTPYAHPGCRAWPMRGSDTPICAAHPGCPDLARFTGLAFIGARAGSRPDQVGHKVGGGGDSALERAMDQVLDELSEQLGVPLYHGARPVPHPGAHLSQKRGEIIQQLVEMRSIPDARCSFLKNSRRAPSRSLGENLRKTPFTV